VSRSLLSDLIEIAPRFTKSINVERDKDVDAIEGYILTSRALDVLERVSLGISNPKFGRSFSLTGPHGGGKSSLAVFLEALSSPGQSERYKKSIQMLNEVDQGIAKKWQQARNSIDPEELGAFSAFVTAQREPVTLTVLRGIDGALGGAAIPPAWLEKETLPSGKEVIDFLRDKLADRWMVLVVDEFGKNLEYFSEDPRTADLFLLQTLAEASQGSDSSLNLVLVTLQHLSFDEYVQNLSANQRREWIKVQGRFQDIAYVESEVQTARLMSRAIQIKDSNLATAVTEWAAKENSSLSTLGYLDGSDIGSELAYPLHPTAQAVLPTLCSRYGQNERTLFSFLAGSEPNALPKLTSRFEWEENESLEWISIVDIYDYFLNSASSIAAGSQGSSRFIEIEGRIRDASGLDEKLKSLLKTVGVFNLISSGGALRASRDLLEFSLVGENQTFLNVPELDKAVEELEASGLLTYREFADEYRIWQGSDFDLKGQVKSAAERLSSTDAASMLNEFFDLDPIVASKHSQEKGIFRVFSQSFVSKDVVFNESPIESDTVDGHLLIALKKDFELTNSEFKEKRPIGLVNVNVSARFISEVKEAAALRASVISAEDSGADWVAMRELRERAAISEIAVKKTLEQMLQSTSEITYVQTGEMFSTKAGLSRGISEICDSAYAKAPIIKNETIAKRVLSNQGAKARRVLLESLMQGASKANFGMAGFGPERAIYEAIFKESGLHREHSSSMKILSPTEPVWEQLWNDIYLEIKSSPRRRTVTSIQSEFLNPPYGLREGVFSLFLLTMVISKSDEIALFEHGSLVVKLDDAVLERLLKNPHFFSLKHLGYSDGTRQRVFDVMCDRFKLQKKDGSRPTFLAAMKSVYRELSALPPTTNNTVLLEAKVLKIRDIFARASELDELLYVDLPTAVIGQRIDPDTDLTDEQLRNFIEEIAYAIKALKNDYQDLMKDFTSLIARNFEAPDELGALRSKLREGSSSILEWIKDGELRSLAPAFLREHIDDESWLENVGLIITAGQPPKHWTDKDREFARNEVVRLGGVFQRMQSLHFDKSTNAKAGSVLRKITITRPDGVEMSKVIQVDEKLVSVARDTLHSLLNNNGVKDGNKAEMTQAMLLALSENFEQ
jgi:hypothetical protein